MHICIHVCMHVLYVCVYVCMYVCMYTYMYTTRPIHVCMHYTCMYVFCIKGIGIQTLFNVWRTVDGPETEKPVCRPGRTKTLLSNICQFPVSKSVFFLICM